MCGILGYSHLAKDLHAWLPMAALEALAHRGPDHQGTFCSEQVSLGATRLRIVDLEDGDQPLFSPDRDVAANPAKPPTHGNSPERSWDEGVDCPRLPQAQDLAAPQTDRFCVS